MNVKVGMSLADIEKEAICVTLKFYGDNKRMTAEVLGISLKTLYNKLNEYSGKCTSVPFPVR